MGLATAHVLGKDHFIVITGRTVAKLEDAITELRTNGIEAEAFACDVSDRDSVEALVKFARQKGDISTVIHAAGVSPKNGKCTQNNGSECIGNDECHQCIL